MDIEHVFVVYDPTTTNRFDLCGRKLVRGIELTHYHVAEASETLADTTAATAARRRLRDEEAAAAAVAAAQAAQALQEAVDDQVQGDWYADMNGDWVERQQDFGADAEDHVGDRNVEGEEGADSEWFADVNGYGGDQEVVVENSGGETTPQRLARLTAEAARLALLAAEAAADAGETTPERIARLAAEAAAADEADNP